MKESLDFARRDPANLSEDSGNSTRFAFRGTSFHFFLDFYSSFSCTRDSSGLDGPVNPESLGILLRSDVLSDLPLVRCARASGLRGGHRWVGCPVRPLDGFLFSFPLGVFAGGLISGKVSTSSRLDTIRVVLASGVCPLLIYVIGPLWLM